MAQCALCGETASEGRGETFWTGVYTRSQLGLGKVTYHYTNLQRHDYFICSACRGRHRRRMLWIALGHVGGALGLATILTLVLPSGSFEIFCLMSLVPALLSLSVFAGVFLFRSPLGKLRKLARQERKRADETGKARIRVFSQKEFDDLDLSWG